MNEQRIREIVERMWDAEDALGWPGVHFIDIGRRDPTFQGGIRPPSGRGVHFIDIGRRDPATV